MKVNIYTTEGKVAKTLDLPEQVFAAEWNADLVSQVLYSQASKGVLERLIRRTARTFADRTRSHGSRKEQAALVTVLHSPRYGKAEV
jgi:ribosomal protein L4